jgi:hypothetical protein
MLMPDPQQWAIEQRELIHTIAKAETQVVALRRFAHCRQIPWPLLRMKHLLWVALFMKL